MEHCAPLRSLLKTHSFLVTAGALPKGMAISFNSLPNTGSGLQMNIQVQAPLSQPLHLNGARPHPAYYNGLLYKCDFFNKHALNLYMDQTQSLVPWIQRCKVIHSVKQHIFTECLPIARKWGCRGDYDRQVPGALREVDDTLRQWENVQQNRHFLPGTLWCGLFKCMCFLTGKCLRTKL